MTVIELPHNQAATQVLTPGVAWQLAEAEAKPKPKNLPMVSWTDTAPTITAARVLAFINVSRIGQILGNEPLLLTTGIDFGSEAVKSDA